LIRRVNSFGGLSSSKPLLVYIFPFKITATLVYMALSNWYLFDGAFSWLIVWRRIERETNEKCFFHVSVFVKVKKTTFLIVTRVL